MNFLRKLFGKGFVRSSSIRSPAITGDAYIDACFQFDFQEHHDTRNWREIPEAQALVKFAREKNTEAALRQCQIVRDNYPDFYWPYYWLATLYGGQGRLEDARQALTEGLGYAKSKYNLCGKMGEIEWEVGNLAEAVKWWLKSVIIQINTDNLDTFTPFLRLSYIAQGFGLTDTQLLLIQYVDNINYAVRYDNEYALEMWEAVTIILQDSIELGISIKQALELLHQEYLS